MAVAVAAVVVAVRRAHHRQGLPLRLQSGVRELVTLFLYGQWTYQLLWKQSVNCSATFDRTHNYTRYFGSIRNTLAAVGAISKFVIFSGC